MLTEAITPSVGAIGLGGVIAFVVGSIMLFNTGVPGYAVNLGVIAGIAVSAAALLALLLATGDPIAASAAIQRRCANADWRRRELLEPVDAGGESWARIAANTGASDASPRCLPVRV